MWMKLRKLLSREPACPTRTRHRFVPQLRPLEDRLAPATFTVNTTLDNMTAGDGKLTLREAITRANNHAGADEVVVPAGVYKIALFGDNDNANLAGDFDVTDTVTIRGAGAGRTVIDGQQRDRVFHGTAPNLIKVVLEGMTIRNGATGYKDVGGGILVNNVNLVVRDCAVTGNSSGQNGGGIYSRPSADGAGQVRLIRCTVARNVSEDGGGIALDDPGVLTVTDSIIRRNVASEIGGGISAVTATLTRTTVVGNTADRGGGISANRGLTLTDSTVIGNTASSTGGGLSALVANLTNSTVIGNTARNSGGGICTDVVTLIGCTVSGNSSGGEGGGVYAYKQATLTRSTISGNSALDGGGIWAEALSLTRSTVNGNSASYSGGGIFASHTATLTRSTISANEAAFDGGGMWANYVALTGCTVSGNTARGGGGIWAGTANLTNSTVSGNTARSSGGGIWAEALNLTNDTVSGNSAGYNGGGVFAIAATLLNCTVVKNSAHTGGGLFHFAFAEGTFSVRNTIVALNLTDFAGAGPDVAGDPFTTQGHNLIGNGSGGAGFTHGVNGDRVGNSADPLDPKLGVLRNNGGPTQTHALLAGSKAIDAGDNAGAPGTDQRGLPRRKDGNGDGRAVVDIGAFER